jgi:hypothetical protein
MVDRLPQATLRIMSGESHLGGLGIAEEILRALLGIWDKRAREELRRIAPARAVELA